MPFVEHSGFRISYELRGEGETVVFMHGLGADKRQSLKTLERLKNYRVLCIDAPGHGDTVTNEGEDLSTKCSFSFFAEVVLAVLDALKIETAVFGGISMGSGISLKIAMERPERVKGLLLVRPAWLDTEGLPQLEIVSKLGEWIERDGVAIAQSRLEKEPLYLEAMRDNPNCAASIAGVLTRPQASESASVLHTMVRDQPFESMSALDGVTQSALVIGNEGDPLHPMEIGETISEHLPHARFEKLPSRYLEAQLHEECLTAELQNFLDETVFAKA